MLWTVTENGKRMPVDADPAEDGTFVLVQRPDSGELLAVHKSKADNYSGEHDGLLYLPHFTTCPNRDSFRRGNVMGLALIVAIVAAVWLLIGIGIGMALASAGTEAAAQVVDDHERSLALELAVCTIAVERAELYMDSIDTWVHARVQEGATPVQLESVDGG